MAFPAEMLDNARACGVSQARSNGRFRESFEGGSEPIGIARLVESGLEPVARNPGETLETWGHHRKT